MSSPRRGDQQRGFALLAALFVLALGTALVARMTGDALAARQH
jgi:type II secretory pathway component PulK